MRALLVGAGAVGLTYGYHLQQGGAEVSYLVKPKYAAEAQRGFTLYQLRTLRRPRQVRLDGAGVLTSAAEVAEQTWDQIWLCVSSTAIRRRDFLGGLLGGLDSGTLVALQPGMDDRRLLLEHWPEERLVQGVITLIAYQAPLPGEDHMPDKGVAFWLPPMSKSPFAGPPDAARAVVKALKAGGMPAGVDANGPGAAASISAVMMPWLVALEAEQWSFRKLKEAPDVMALAAASATQALAIVEKETGRRAPASLRGLGTGSVRALMGVADTVLPLPIQPYLAYHFTKVGDQTRQMIRTYIDKGRQYGLPTDRLQELTLQIPFG